MPYAISDQSNLPANVKKLSPKKRRQWIHVWNSAHKRTDDESKAFAMANAAVKSRGEKSVSVRIFSGPNDSDLPAEIKNLSSQIRRSWVSSYNYYVTSNGGDEDAAMGYAYENTYVPLCDVIGDGYSKSVDDGEADGEADDGEKPAKKELTEEEKKERDKEPREVKPRVEPAGKSILSVLVEGIKSLGRNKSASADAEEPSALTFYKQNDGSIRAFMIYSNQFKDHHKEIIPEAAHKEYVEWVEKTGNYPEFHLWHCGPGSRWGKADFVDYVDGFAIMSGPVDTDKIHIAEALQKQKGLKVSHGFYGIKSADGTYLIYRPFEGCPLPGNAAANEWTAVSIGSKEFTMPFSDARKAFLKSVGMSETDITKAEGGIKELGDTLKEAGIEWKEADAPGTNAGGTSLSVDASSMILGEIRTLTDAMKQLASVVVVKSKELTETKAILDGLVENNKKSVEDQVEAALTARVAGAISGGGFRASESGANAISKEAGEKAKDANGDGDMSFFGNLIDQQFASVLGGTAVAAGSNGTGAAS